MDTYFIIRILIYGYIIGGIQCILKASSAPPIDRPGFMINPTPGKTFLFAAIWPVYAYVETFYTMLPKKNHARVYAIVTVPLLWLGFSLFAGISLSPFLFLESTIFAAIASILLFLIGLVILMPLISVVFGLLAVLIAKPITWIIPSGE